MTLRKQVKYNAKRCLCNNWGKAISIVLLSYWSCPSEIPPF